MWLSMWIRYLIELTRVATEIVSRVDARLWQSIADGCKRSADESKGLKQKFLLHNGGGDRVSDGLNNAGETPSLISPSVVPLPLHSLATRAFPFHASLATQVSPRNDASLKPTAGSCKCLSFWLEIWMSLHPNAAAVPLTFSETQSSSKYKIKSHWNWLASQIQVIFFVWRLKICPKKS